MQCWIKVYVSFDIGTGDGGYVTETYWHQGEVIKILPKRNWQKVEMLIDGMPDKNQR